MKTKNLTFVRQYYPSFSFLYSYKGREEKGKTENILAYISVAFWFDKDDFICIVCPLRIRI